MYGVYGEETEKGKQISRRIDGDCISNSLTLATYCLRDDNVTVRGRPRKVIR